MYAVTIQALLVLMFIFLGVMIKYFKWSWLIAGYNTSSKEEKEKYDEIALCRYIGNLMFALGALIFISALGTHLEHSWLVTTSWIFFSAVIIIAVIYANTGNRLKNKAILFLL